MCVCVWWRWFSRPSVVMPAGGVGLFGAPQCDCQSAGHHTHKLSHTHTHAFAVFRTSHRRGAREVRVLPPSNPNHPSYWHGLRAVQAWERQRPAGSDTHACQTREVHASCTCSHWPPSHTHTLKCVCFYLLLAGASKLPSETQMWRATCSANMDWGTFAHFKFVDAFGL